MDGLSAAASVIAVSSAAVQLADGIKKIRDFWCSIKDAPDDVRAIAGDLVVLSRILAEISLEARDQSPSMEAALLRCIDGTKPLTAIVEDLEPGFASKSARTRKWSALKTAFKGEKIKKYQSSLEGVKTSLSLAQQSHYGLINRRQYEALQLQSNQSIQAISELRLQNSSTQNTTFSTNVSSKPDHIRALSQEILHIMSSMPKSAHLPGFEKKIKNFFEDIFEKLESEASDEDVEFAKQQSNLPENHIVADSTLENKNPRPRDWIRRTIKERDDVLKNAFGTIYVQSRKSELKSRYSENHRQYEHETSFTVCPAWWLVKVGFSYVPRFSLLSSTIQGWKHTLNSFRSVPDNALIFEFCTTGNISGVQALLARGEASVKDIDSVGRTALHFAAERHHVQICKLLISEGADKDVSDWKGSWTPLVSAAFHNSKTILDVADCMDTIRLFADSMDFSHAGGTGWSTLIYLFNQFNDFHFEIINNAEISSLLLWILHLSASDFKESLSTEAFSFLVALSSTHRAVEVNNLLLTFYDHTVETRPDFEGYSSLQIFISFAGWNKDISIGLNSILDNGASLHLVGYEIFYSIKRETPTSLAMYSSFVFMKWRDALLRLSVDLERFVGDEVKQSPLKDAGWDEVSLLALFHCDIQSDYIPSIRYRCVDCSTWVWGIRVELSWREWLNHFKQKTKAEISSDGESSGAEHDWSDGEITEKKVSSLAAEETVLNESCEGEEVVDETTSSDLYESKTEIETSDAYFGDRTGFVCMHCYLKREGYDSDTCSKVFGRRRAWTQTSHELVIKPYTF